MTSTGGAVPTETHSNQVYTNRPTHVTNLPGPIKEPLKPESGDLTLPTAFPGQPAIQGQTLTLGEALTQSGKLISLASDGSRLIVGTSTFRISEGQSVVAEGQQQSLIHDHPVAASGIVPMSGTVVSRGSGLPSTVMGTQVQATGSQGTGSPSRGLFNGTSPLAFQGYATRAQVMWGRFATIAFFALVSMWFV